MAGSYLLTRVPWLLMAITGLGGGILLPGIAIPRDGGFEFCEAWRYAVDVAPPMSTPLPRAFDPVRCALLPPGSTRYREEEEELCRLVWEMLPTE